MPAITTRGRWHQQDPAERVMSSAQPATRAHVGAGATRGAFEDGPGRCAHQADPDEPAQGTDERSAAFPASWAVWVRFGTGWTGSFVRPRGL